jgi:hypothetical protein
MGLERATTKSGAAKVMTVASARDMRRRPKRMLAPARRGRSPRTACRSGRSHAANLATRRVLRWRE